MLKVRKVVNADKGGIISIVEGCDNLSAEEKACAAELLDEYLLNAAQRDYLFIACTGDDDAPVGFACYGEASLSKAAFDIYWVVVASGERKKGAGKTLVSALEAAIKEAGGRMAVAETSGLPSYAPARTLYEKSGFREEARIKDFFRPGDDKVVYVKRF